MLIKYIMSSKKANQYVHVLIKLSQNVRISIPRC